MHTYGSPAAIRCSLIFALLLSACGGGGDSASNSTTPTASAQLQTSLNTRAAFALADLDHSADLSLAEAQQRVASLSPAEFAALDNNQDQLLQPLEVNPSLTGAVQALVDALTSLAQFNAADTDRDQQLSLAEARQLSPLLQQAEWVSLAQKTANEAQLHAKDLGLMESSQGVLTRIKTNLYGANPEDRLNNAQIRLWSYDANGQLLEQQQGRTNQGGFASRLKLAAQAGYVVIEAELEGYTSMARRLDYQSASDLQLSASMDKLPEVVSVLPGSMLGSTEPAYRLELVKSRDGTRQLRDASKPRVRAVAEQTELAISIPASSVMDPNAPLDARMNSYDPTNPKDAEYFPGQYLDSEGNRLQSVAFDYIDIKQAGVNIGVSNASVRGLRAAISPSLIERAIPVGSCASLVNLGDADAQLSGFQIPVYTYVPSKGVWQLLGKGTVTDGQGQNLKVVNLADCQQGRMLLSIAVTNDAFVRSWWNLDYPLMFSQPVELCADIRLEDQNQQPITSAWVAVFDDADNTPRSFSESYAISDAQGRVQLKTALLDNSTDRQASLRLWSYATNAYVTQKLELGAWGACPQEVIQLQRQDTCEVNGRLQDELGGPLADLPLVMWSSDPDNGHFATALTDNQGQFRTSVLCNAPYQLWASPAALATVTPRSLPFPRYYGFKVNGQVDLDELSDNGQRVDLGAKTQQNQAPIGYVYPLWSSGADYLLQEGKEVRLNIWAYDVEQNTPIGYRVNLGKVSKTGTITPNADGSAQVLNMGVFSAGNYNLSFQFTDNKGKTSEESSIAVSVVKP